MAGVRSVVTVARTSPLVRFTGFIALMAVGALSLRISLTNAFVFAKWADAISYAEGARRAYAGMTPYTEMQLSGPYPLDAAILGHGFVYPPSGAYLLMPFTLGEPFFYAWNALSFVGVIGIVLLMVRREVGRMSGTMALAVGAVAATAFQVGFSDLEAGYISPMVAAAMGSMWLWPRWSAIPALLCGLIKVFPAEGLLWTIRKKGVWKGPLLVAVAIGALITIAHPRWLTDWLTALGNAEAACPPYALWSFACVGLPAVVGYVAGLALLLASWRAKRDDVSFLLLGLAMTVPLPDIYWGNLMVPMIAAIPLVIQESRRWLAAGAPHPIVSTRRSASSME
ncbi:MAG: hypothetical protein AABM41_03260 [Chloroflexota bacterium]